MNRRFVDTATKGIAGIGIIIVLYHLYHLSAIAIIGPRVPYVDDQLYRIIHLTSFLVLIFLVYSTLRVRQRATGLSLAGIIPAGLAFASGVYLLRTLRAGFLRC